jgi:hypothetical protein
MLKSSNFLGINISKLEFEYYATIKFHSYSKEHSRQLIELFKSIEVINASFSKEKSKLPVPAWHFHALINADIETIRNKEWLKISYGERETLIKRACQFSPTGFREIRGKVNYTELKGKTYTIYLEKIISIIGASNYICKFTNVEYFSNDQSYSLKSYSQSDSSEPSINLKENTDIIVPEVPDMEYNESDSLDYSSSLSEKDSRTVRPKPDVDDANGRLNSIKGCKLKKIKILSRSAVFSNGKNPMKPQREFTFQNLNTKEVFLVTDLQLRKIKRNKILVTFLNKYNIPHQARTIYLLNFQIDFSEKSKLGYEINRIKSKLKKKKNNILAHIGIRDFNPVNNTRHLNLILVVNYIPDMELKGLLDDFPSGKIIENLQKTISYFKQLEIYAPYKSRSFYYSKFFK